MWRMPGPAAAPCRAARGGGLWRGRPDGGAAAQIWRPHRIRRNGRAADAALDAGGCWVDRTGAAAPLAHLVARFQPGGVDRTGAGAQQRRARRSHLDPAHQGDADAAWLGRDGPRQGGRRGLSGRSWCARPGARQSRRAGRRRAHQRCHDRRLHPRSAARRCGQRDDPVLGPRAARPAGGLTTAPPHHISASWLK